MININCRKLSDSFKVGKSKMKIIRQSEVYQMEEAVTDQIVGSTQSMILDVD